MNIIFVLLVLIFPISIYAKKIKLENIPESCCINCISIHNSSSNKGFNLIEEKNKRIIYGKNYKDLLLEFNNAFYFFYRIEISAEDGRSYISLKVISIGTLSNVKIVFNLHLSPYELFETYDDFEGRNIVFLTWTNSNTFKVQINDSIYVVELLLERENSTIVMYAESKKID